MEFEMTYLRRVIGKSRSDGVRAGTITTKYDTPIGADQDKWYKVSRKIYCIQNEKGKHPSGEQRGDWQIKRNVCGTDQDVVWKE